MKNIRKFGIRSENILAILLLLATGFGTVNAEAAGRINSLSWESGDKPELLIKTSGELKYEKRLLQGGQRLRLIFRDTTIGSSVVDIDGKGFVKGVYPYLASDGTSTNIDFLVNVPGSLSVDKVRGGYRVSVKQSSSATGTVTGSAGANNIKGIRYSSLPGGRVQVVIQMDHTPLAPKSFSITNPARISLDFDNTGVTMARRTVSVKQGAVTSVTAIEAEGKSRVVLNLIKPVAYKAAVEENAYVLTLQSPTVSVGQEEAAQTTHFAGKPSTGKYSLKGIDFRRDSNGGGKIIVTLSDPSIGIDIKEQAGEILVDFLDTSVPSELVRRLDVLDFATPVETIDTVRRGKNTRLIIHPKGKYEQLAYQTGDVFTINVKPIPEEEQAKKKKDEFGYSGEKLSLNFQKIPVRDALQVLADFTGLNFVISDRVKGNLTLRLKDVPWDQAMDIILDSQNLGMRQKGNVVLIAPAKEIAAREKAELEATQTVHELEPLVSELIKINYAKASEIAALLKSIKAVAPTTQPGSPFSTTSFGEVKTDSNSLLSKRGQVTVDERTNSILIQDTATKITEVRKLIAQLDQPVRQVLIESRLVEATDTFAKSLGSRFGVISQNGTVGTSNYQSTAGALETNVDLYNASASGAGSGSVTVIPGGLNVNLPSPGVGGEAPGQWSLSLATISGNLLQLELSALEQEGNGKIISSPRIITANQKQATIEQGQEYEFSAGFGVSKTISATLKLDVTPQITPDDRVILDVQINKDSFVGASDRINKKQIKTSVLLDNGETVAIGGIYEQEEGVTRTRVPLFGRLPLVGWMFRKKEVTNNKTELLIFLTPRILSESLQLK
ncbi:MAG: type IV pilus secretin PilQ [Acidiferrobacterales bacterium]